VEKFRENAYRVKLPEDMSISDVFNVRHLHKYYGENTSLRSSFSSPQEPDAVREEYDPEQEDYSDTDPFG
jgi:hypothetical protein